MNIVGKVGNLQLRVNATAISEDYYDTDDLMIVVGQLLVMVFAPCFTAWVFSQVRSDIRIC